MGKKHPLRLWLLATVIACMTAFAVLLCGWLAMINSETGCRRTFIPLLEQLCLSVC